MTLHRFTFRAMAAENEVQVHCDDAARAEAGANAAIAEVNRVEAKYSRYREDSVLSRINAAAGGAAVAVDDETMGLLAFADACFRQSEGLFDATSGVLRRAWNFREARVPTGAELGALLPLVGWDRVEISNAHVRLPRAGMELDFGGFGKEYAVDRAALVMRTMGFASAMVNLAGDLVVLGPQPGGTPWRLGIRHPRRDDKLLASLPVTSGAIATSGDYERFVEVEGVRYCHILDPRSGMPARGLQSVTVHGASCLVAGSATTIAMLMGADSGPQWLQELGLAHLCVAEDGTVIDRF
ncbi:MAG: FAD:protein FMN transferase [Burkholderiales bacterium]|nr:FAD:protein FMN transferase [Burkholderiales bacterium]